MNKLSIDVKRESNIQDVLKTPESPKIAYEQEKVFQILKSKNNKELNELQSLFETYPNLNLDFNIKDEESSWHETPLTIAINLKDENIVGFLLKKGASPNLGIYTNSTADNLTTPLGLASKNGSLEIVKKLFLYKVDSQEKSAGSHPIALAAKGNHTGVVEYLLLAGADIDGFYDTQGYRTTPQRTSIKTRVIHYAVKNKNIDLVQYLIANHANLNAKILSASDGQEIGNTALHIACELGHEEILTILLKNGADFRVENKVGKTPLQLAEDNNHQKCAQLINSYNSCENMYFASFYKSYESSRRLGCSGFQIVEKTLKIFGAKGGLFSLKGKFNKDNSQFIKVIESDITKLNSKEVCRFEF